MTEKEIKGKELNKEGETEMGKEKKTATTVENDEEMTFTPVSESSKEVKEDEETETIPDEEVEVIEEDEETTFTAVGDEEKAKEKSTDDLTNNIYDVAKDVIENFKRVISSDEVNQKIKNKAKEKNIPEEKLKGTFIRNIGRTISNLLNLGLDFVGSTVKALFGLLNSVVRSIVDYASVAIRKLIAFITLTPAI